MEAKSKTRNLTVRLPDDLREWLEVKAKREMRPAANLIAWILNEYRQKEGPQ
jgi:hypothetical protein